MSRDEIFESTREEMGKTLHMLNTFPDHLLEDPDTRELYIHLHTAYTRLKEAHDRIFSPVVPVYLS